jgi:AraC-like DNA-binding protein
MSAYFGYYPCGAAEQAWGFHVSAAGFTRIAADRPYPPPRHPQDHALDWTHGRVLPAFQLVVLQAGEGQFDSEPSGLRRVRKSEGFLLFPGIRHRYRPNPKTGWTEHWFELDGPLVGKWLDACGFDPAEPILRLRRPAPVWELFKRFHTLCQAQPNGYRPVVASLALAILAEIRAQSSAAEMPADSLVRRLHRLQADTVHSSLKVCEMASQLGISYPTLHRRFLRETGLSPKQYLKQTRLARAAQWLSGSRLTLKEIAARLGYSSAFHFSRDFKQHHRLSPLAWRRRYR